MKRKVGFCLMVCMLAVCLCACAPKAPTADFHAIRLGDTEKQVMEKAGKPDFKVGIAHDVFGYEIEPAGLGEKLIWFYADKVIMMGAHNGAEFVAWETDVNHKFQSLENPEKISFWEAELEPVDIVGCFGPGFSAWDTWTIGEAITYELADGQCVQFRFDLTALNEVIRIAKDGAQTVIWAYEPL